MIPSSLNLRKWKTGEASIPRKNYDCNRFSGRRVFLSSYVVSEQQQSEKKWYYKFMSNLDKDDYKLCIQIVKQNIHNVNMIYLSC